MKYTSVIREFILSNLEVGIDGNNIDNSESLIEKGVIDSLGIMKLITFLEEKFEIQVDEDELIPENFETVNAISTLVAEKLNS